MEIKKGNNCFYVGESEEKREAIITFYYDNTKTLVIDHTYVDEKFRGQGLARELVNAVVDYARREKLVIRPLCSYARKVLQENQYDDVCCD
jgi:predicted GNAT family acetyltransferase